MKRSGQANRRSVTQRAGQRIGTFFLVLILATWGAAIPRRVYAEQPTFDPPLGPELQRGLQRPAPPRTPEVLAAAATASGANTVLELPPTADTYVALGRPTQNFGGDTLFLGYNNVGDQFGTQRTFIRFDIAGNIPSVATIQSARLRLHLSFASPNADVPMNTLVQRVTSTWDETLLTWNNQPSGTDERPGVAVGNALDWVEWDVTDLVAGWSNGTFSNNGLLIIGDEQVQERERAFYARETTTTFFPRLVIDYTTPQDLEAPIVTVEPLPGYVSRSFTVAWRGSDPGGSGIAHYDVQYRVNGGDWVNWQTNVTTTAAEFPAGQNGQHLEFRARGVDRAGNVEGYGNPEAATVVDTEPPAAQVQALPTIVHTNTLTITWRGTDNGGSGIQYFDVRYRMNEGTWVAWQQQTITTTAVFTTATDALYDFEARAVDNRGQVEPFHNVSEARVIVDAFAPFVVPSSWLPFVSSETPTQ